MSDSSSHDPVGAGVLGSLAGEEFGRLATSAAGSVAIAGQLLRATRRSTSAPPNVLQLVNLVLASSVAFEIDQGATATRGASSARSERASSTR